MASSPLTVLVRAGLAVAVLVLMSLTAHAQTLYYIHADYLNTPRLLTDQNQAVVWRWDPTEPFGDSAGVGSVGRDGFVVTVPLRYPGQYFDKETNLNYNYFRDYDPTIGRYVQSDPFGLQGGINTYSYVDSNPLTWVDPGGLQIAPPTQGGIGGFGGLGGFSSGGVLGGKKKPNDPSSELFDPNSSSRPIFSESQAPTPEEIVAGAPVPPFSIRDPQGQRIPFNPALCSPGRTLTAPSTQWPGGVSVEREFVCQCGTFTWHLVYFMGKYVHNHFRPGPAKGTGGD